MTLYSPTSSNLFKLEKFLSALYSFTEKQISTLCPEHQGTVRISTSHGKTTYYYNDRDPKGSEKYIKREDIQFAADIVQRSYCKEVLRVISIELDFARKAVASYEFHNILPKEPLDSIQKINSVYSALVKGRRELVTPILTLFNKYADDWSKEDFERLTRSSDSPYFGVDGPKGRSKIEFIISNMLDKFHIPYRYEFRLIYGEHGESFYPDFMIMNPLTHEIVFWEHFGMFGDADYRTKSLKKLSIYASMGIVVGKNLIITIEDENNPLSPELIERIIIENFCLEK